MRGSSGMSLLVDSGPCEPEPGNCRPAERGQVDAVQRADAQRRAGGQLPVRDDRTQRGRGAAARSAARQACRVVRLGEDRACAGDVRRHRRHRQGRVGGRRARQQVPGQHPRVRRDLSGGAGVRRRRRGARRRPGRSQQRHRGHRDRADPRRHADAGEGGAPAGEGGPQQQGPQAGARGGGGRPADTRRRHHAVRGRCRRVSCCASST